MFTKPMLAALTLPLLLSAQTTPVVQLQNLAHTTETLDKTVPFYRDTLGFTMNGNPLASQPQKLNEEMSKFTGTSGMSFRAATFRIPNAGFGFELTEFTGAGRKSGVPKIQDIGAAVLSLQVRDVNAMLAKVKAAPGVTIVTVGGVPVNNEVVVRDPDGFLVQFMQPARIPEGVTGDIVGASVHLAIEDSAKSVEFFRKAIGYTARPTSAMATNADVVKLTGLPAGAQWRITHGSIPGTTTDFALIEYNAPRTKFVLGAQDPGSPAFTMVVGDINAAVDQWVAAGGTVATTGGKAIVQASGAGNVFVRDVNGFMWELIQRPTAAKGKTK
jgi:catechol 2,3-dioxygenase-like lactoylglutathione lyase family enzyme